MPSYDYEKEDDSRKIKDREIIKRLAKYIKPYVWILVILLITVLISSFALSYVNDFFGDILDILEVEGTTFNDVFKIGVWIIIFLVVSFTVTYIRSIVLAKISQKVLVSIRSDVFDHIEKLSLKELDKIPVGKLVTRVTNDTNALSELFTDVLINLISNITTLLFAVILMFDKNVKLTLIIACLFPVLIIATEVFRRVSRKQFRKVSHNNSRVNSYLSENLSGMKITQIFNRENIKQNEFDDLNETLTHSQYGTTLIFGIFRPFIYAIYFTAIIISLYFGSKYVQAGLLTSGALYAFYLYIGQLFNPIQQIAQQFNVLQSAFASAEKILTIMDTKSSITFSDSPLDASLFKGEIEFRDVWFKYDEDWIIKGMTFHVLPGETVAFVGPTGAGKTTILSLIGRYYDVDKGEILIDGINIKNYDIYSLRKNIGEMLQDVFLFSGTIKDNITLRDDTIKDEDIIKSCEFVNADKFINRLPNKYDEVVKERGNNYSQGERQLLSFARTIVFKPKMIILDEATSNIDTETEVLIQDSLEKIKTIGTTLMVAHRLSTIQHSDKIMFIDDGKIIECGNHQELLKLKGRYFKLFELQYE